MQTQKLDALTTKHTSFTSFHDLLNAGGDYYPHFEVGLGDEGGKVELAELAKAYDAGQAERGDSRRAHVTHSH